jgi:hypothetical protein
MQTELELKQEGKTKSEKPQTSEVAHFDGGDSHMQRCQLREQSRVTELTEARHKT